MVNMPYLEDRELGFCPYCLRIDVPISHPKGWWQLNEHVTDVRVAPVETCVGSFKGAYTFGLVTDVFEGSFKGLVRTDNPNFPDPLFFRVDGRRVPSLNRPGKWNLPRTQGGMFPQKGDRIVIVQYDFRSTGWEVIQWAIFESTAEKQ